MFQLGFQYLDLRSGIKEASSGEVPHIYAVTLRSSGGQRLLSQHDPQVGVFVCVCQCNVTINDLI